MQISVFTPAQAAELMMLADHHTRDAMLIDRTLLDFYRLRNTPKAVLCFCCGAPVACPSALVAITPHVDHPTKAIGGVVCPQGCYGTEHEMKDRAFAAWRERVDPGARVLMVPTAGETRLITPRARARRRTAMPASYIAAKCATCSGACPDRTKPKPMWRDCKRRLIEQWPCGLWDQRVLAGRPQVAGSRSAPAGSTPAAIIST